MGQGGSLKELNQKHIQICGMQLKQCLEGNSKTQMFILEKKKGIKLTT